MSFTEENRMWNLSSSGASLPYSPPADRIYLSGYHMVEYLNSVYGKESLPELIKYQAKHPILGTRGAISKIYKKSPDVIYTEYLDYLYNRAEIFRTETLKYNLPKGITVISEPIDNIKSHFWTKNGTIKAIRQGYDKKTAVIEINPENGNILNETKTGNINSISKIRHTSNDNLVFGEIFYHPLGGGELDSADLVVFNPDNKKHIRLTNGEHIYSADLSPDGRTFVAARRNGMWIELILLDNDGNNIRKIVSETGLYADSPCWSPDGSSIVSAVKIGRKSDIVTIDSRTGNMETLFSSDIHGDNDPSFSPDGRWIVFSSDRSGVWNIYAWSILRKKLYQMTSEYYAASEPCVSPDMKTLSYLSLYRGVTQLCRVPFEPEAGLEIKVEEGELLDKPDISRIDPDIKFSSERIPLWEACKPFLHIPYFMSDENGDRFGAVFVGADPVGINSYSAEIFYNEESERPSYDISIINKSFWPIIRTRIYDNNEHEKNTLGTNILNEETNYREKGAEVSFGLDVIHKTAPGYIRSSYVVGSRLRYFSGYDYGEINNKKSLGLYCNFELNHIPNYAPRDIIPDWGQSFSIYHEEELSGFIGEIEGHKTIMTVKQYVPSFLKHHGIETTLAHQNLNGLIQSKSDVGIPRGYHYNDTNGDLNLRKNLLMSVEYHFPLWYADRGLGLILFHMNLLKGSLFADCGAGWDGNFDFRSWKEKARTSVGGS